MSRVWVVPGLLLLATLGGWLGLPELQAETSPRATAPLGLAQDVLWLRSPLAPLAHIAAGSFQMGSSAEDVQRAFAACKGEPLRGRCQIEQFGDEQPLREITLSAYWVQRHEVSVGDFDRCVAARRCRPLPYFRGSQRFRRDSYPASLASWHDARDYCAFFGGRLPTEAEFERAARGSARRTYPWGALYNARASNHGRLATDRTSDVDGYLELAEVGSFPEGATPEGVLDLAGNVAEWVWDRYAQEYDARELRNPVGPESGSASNQRVVRGGGYESPPFDLRGAARAGVEPSTRRPSLGFRCVKPAGG